MGSVVGFKVNNNFLQLLVCPEVAQIAGILSVTLVPIKLISDRSYPEAEYSSSLAVTLLHNSCGVEVDLVESASSFQWKIGTVLFSPTGRATVVGIPSLT